MNEAIAEPIVRLAPERSAGEQFEALYQRTFPRVYAYVASMLRDRSTRVALIWSGVQSG